MPIRLNKKNHQFLFFFCVTLFCFGLSKNLNAQHSLHLNVKTLDQPENFIEKIFPQDPKFPDTTSLYLALQQLLDDLQNEAFLSASIDSVQIQDSIYTAYLFAGPSFTLANISNGNVEQFFLDQSGFRERLYRNKPLRYAMIRKLMDGLLEFAENHGYPFASVWLDSIQIKEDRVSAQLFMDKNKLVLLEEVKITGDAKVSTAYLMNYLGLKPGGLYDKSKILRIKDRIRELPFLTVDKDPTITFKGDRAIVNLILKKKKASRFDFLVGVLPNPRPDAGGGQNKKILVTGTFNGELQNQFSLGERIYAEFEQLRPETQQLDIQFNYPYVLNFPFGVDLKFDLYKRDTTYLDLEYDIGIQYLFEGGNYLKAFWNNRSSTLLAINESRLIATEELPANLDVSNASFGLEYALQKLDYRYNPRKGWAILGRAGAGIKKIKRNNRILELDFGELYDSLELRSFLYRIEGQLEAYLPLFKTATFKTSLQGGFILADNPIFLNEQYRIGGNRLLRGFDEEFIFATQYAVLTFEPRLLIGQNSYLYLFGDYAFVQDRTTEKNESLFPFGFGTGITFETSVGVFGISLAFGKLRNEPIDFSAPKVHFGYVSRF